MENIPTIFNKLRTIQEVGLGYIKLGQPATTLSGGEAQRIKLSKELSKRSTGRTLYILDEPTTGLHFADIRKLLDVLLSLVDGGNTVVVIEHNMDVIKVADHIIDLGPEGGDEGGKIIATGSPEKVAKAPGSYTGLYLREVIANEAGYRAYDVDVTKVATIEGNTSGKASKAVPRKSKSKAVKAGAKGKPTKKSASRTGKAKTARSGPKRKRAAN
jgi:excinuclease ABC subunit A